MNMTDIPKSCRECGLDATTCKAPYYGGSMCKHEKAIVAKTLSKPFYKLKEETKMKKLIAMLLALILVIAMTVPASAATGNFDIGKAQPAINKAVTEIVNKPSFNWNSWLSQIMSSWK